MEYFLITLIIFVLSLLAYGAGFLVGRWYEGQQRDRTDRPRNPYYD